MSQFTSRFLNRTVAPYLAILVLTIISTAIFHFVEKSQQRSYDKRVQEDYKCIGNYTSIAVSLFYVISLCSTIGFGTLYPCTTASRVISIPILLMGITLFLYIVADIGERTDKIARHFYNRIARKRYHEWCMRRRLKKLRERIPPDEPGIETSRTFSTVVLDQLTGAAKVEMGNGAAGTEPFCDLGGAASDGIPFIDLDDGDEPGTGRLTDGGTNKKYRSKSQTSSLESEFQDDHLPVSIGLTAIFVCIAASTVYYAWAENYSYGEAVYFSFLAFFAGDFIAYNFSAAVPMFAFIFTGFIMMSMTVNTILANLRNLVRRVKHEAKRTIESTDFLAVEKLPQPGDGDIAESRQKLNPRELVQQLVAKYGAAWVISYIPESEFQAMEHYCAEAVQKVREAQLMQAQITDMSRRITSLQEKVSQEFPVCKSTGDVSTETPFTIDNPIAGVGCQTDPIAKGSTSTSQTQISTNFETRSTQTIKQEAFSKGSQVVDESLLFDDPPLARSNSLISVKIDCYDYSPEGSDDEFSILDETKLHPDSYRVDEPECWPIVPIRLCDWADRESNSQLHGAETTKERPELADAETQTDIRRRFFTRRTVGTQFPGKFRRR